MPIPNEREPPPSIDLRRDGSVARRIGDLWALLVVLAALVLPDRPDRLSALAIVAVPIEIVLGGAVVLILPAVPRRLFAACAGLVLGVITLLKIIDLGFYEALARPFDPVLDVTLLDDAVRLLSATFGRWGGLGVGLLAISLSVLLVVVLAAAMLRLARAAVGHRAMATWVITLCAVGWLALATAGAQFVPGRPVASQDETRMAVDRITGVERGLADRRSFEREAAVDAFADRSNGQLLTALRGKDVVLAVVESYGRSAIEDPRIAPPIDDLLDRGSRELAAAGFGARSGFLTSATVGGSSWLAHSTLQSGLWIDNQSRYRELVSSDRLTLTAAFARAGWNTVEVAPGTTRAWPEGAFFGFDRVLDQERLGYRGPSFSWAAMPDQYTLATFQRLERQPGHPPLMAEVTLVSSHAPWTPVPSMIDWAAVGDGSTYAAMAGPNRPPEAILTTDPAQVRADYARAVDYSLASLISYVRTYGDPNLVLIMVGDHQPSPVVTGDRAGRDVPITIVSADRAVLARISDWGWTDGLRPAHDAPVWRMDAFRDRFLSAFGPTTGVAGPRR